MIKRTLWYSTRPDADCGHDRRNLDQLRRLFTWAADGLVNADPSSKSTVGTVRLPSLT